MNPRYRTTYKIRKAFAANLVLFLAAAVACGTAAYQGNFDLYALSEKFFAFHLFICMISLLSLRLFPNPDLEI